MLSYELFIMQISTYVELWCNGILKSTFLYFSNIHYWLTTEKTKNQEIKLENLKQQINGVFKWIWTKKKKKHIRYIFDAISHDWKFIVYTK